MKLVDYIILGGVALLVAGVVYHLIKRKKRGEGGCGCGCQGCPSAGSCQARKSQEKENEEAV